MNSQHHSGGWKGARPASTQGRNSPYKFTVKWVPSPGLMATRSSLLTGGNLCGSSFPRLN